MAKDNQKFYSAKELITDKDKFLTYYIKYMLSRTQSMFTYTGLPETIPQSKLEYILQTSGYAFITEHENKLYALQGNLSGQLDVYNDFTKIIISNTALNLAKEFDIETDGVLIENDTMQLGLLPILQKYGVLLAENTITIHSLDIILRIALLISASDDRTYNGAEKFIKDIENGKISAVGESAFFEGVRVHSPTHTQNYINQFIELEQYLKASCFNEIGLNANYNMKRAELNSNEVSMNDDFLLPLIDNMIKCREVAINKINKKYNLEISIDYASAWKITHAENLKQIAISENITSQVEKGENLDMTIDQKMGIHDINNPTINLNSENTNTSDNNDNTSQEPHNIDKNENATDTTTIKANEPTIEPEPKRAEPDTIQDTIAEQSEITEIEAPNEPANERNEQEPIQTNTDTEKQPETEIEAANTDTIIEDDKEKKK